MAVEEDEDPIFTFSAWDVWHVAEEEKSPLQEPHSPSTSPLLPMRPGVRAGALQVSRWRQAMLTARPDDRFAAKSAAGHAAWALGGRLDERPPLPNPGEAPLCCRQSLDQRLAAATANQARFASASPLWTAIRPVVELDACGKVAVTPHCRGKLHEEGTSALSSFCDDGGSSDEEEQAWEQQRVLAGLVGRLVCYQSSTQMKEDFTLRPGLRKSGAVVATLRSMGLAQQAGVNVGDRLVSINGSKVQDVAECLNMGSLVGVQVPANLVFMGYVGKITSEVRLVSSHPGPRLEMGFTLAGDKVWAGARTKYVYEEECVLNPQLASLTLGVQESPAISPRQMFALEPTEAAHLVRRAKTEAETQLRQRRLEVAQWDQDSEGHGWRSSSRGRVEDSQGAAFGDEEAMGPSLQAAGDSLAPLKPSLMSSGIEELCETEESEDEMESRRL